VRIRRNARWRIGNDVGLYRPNRGVAAVDLRIMPKNLSGRCFASKSIGGLVHGSDDGPEKRTAN
jgi:hypothetical protein